MIEKGVQVKTIWGVGIVTDVFPKPEKSQWSARTETIVQVKYPNPGLPSGYRTYWPAERVEQITC